MEIMEISSLVCANGNLTILSSFLYTDKSKAEEHKKLVKKNGYKYNRQTKRYEKYLKSLDVTLTHSFDILER